MDPNTVLRIIREACATLVDTPDGEAPDALTVDSLVNACESIDRWITMGGFLPDDWRDISERTAPGRHV